MQETLLEQDLANMDLSNVAALQQKRTLAFVNHFVITTVQFLNSFMKSCEQKLMQFERKLENVNAAMVLLEAKLSSIPELDVPTQTVESKENVPQKSDPEKSAETVNETNTSPGDESTQETAPVKPEYERFVKMVQVGVPLDAVKLKITLEGLNPQELDRILKK